jgi:hypothetical protein
MAGVVAMPTAKKTQHAAAWVFVPLGIAFLIIAGIAVFGIVSPYSLKPAPPPPGTHGSLVWGDGIFSNQAQLKAWLRIHGASYDEWVKTHPAALELVKPHAKHHSAALTKNHARPAAPLRTVAVSQTTAPTKQSGTGVWLVVLLGLMLGALAGTPHKVLARAGVRIQSHERELRIAAIGAGAALLLGVIAATLVS